MVLNSVGFVLGYIIKMMACLFAHILHHIIIRQISDCQRLYPYKNEHLELTTLIWMSQCSGWHSCFIFQRHPVSILARRLVRLTKYLGFPQSLQANAGNVQLKIGNNHFHMHPSQPIIHNHVICHCITNVDDSTIQEIRMTYWKNLSC
jgi:hypothetical protein